MSRIRSLLALVCLMAGAACAVPLKVTPPPETVDSAPAAEESRPASVVPLLGTEPSTAGDNDLRTLAGWLAGARIVGLGEGLHGTHELHRLAHRIFSDLVEHEGFTVFALEVDQAHAALLNEYVLGTRDDLDGILDESWWASAIFYDEALRELLVWMRDFNKSASRPVHFAGYDLKQPDLAVRALLDHLRERDRAAAVEVEQRFAEIARLGGFGGVPSFLGYSATLPLSLPPGDAAPRPLNVALRVRASGFSRGTVGLTLRAGTAAPVIRALGAEELSERDAWKPLEVSLEVPAGATEATLTLFHRGNGTVWFDGLGAALAGKPLPEIAAVTGSTPVPLQIPHLQVMDYSATADSKVTFDGGTSLRVQSDPRLDVALAAAERISAIVDDHLRQDSVPPAGAAWLRQLARLVRQATEWRTLAELNRDVLMAENLLWLAREAHPGARILALGHTSHTERLPRRMGAFLAESLGATYKTVSLLPLEGRYRDFGGIATLRAGDPLQLFPLKAEAAGPLARYVAGLGSGDLLVALRNVPAAEGRHPAGVVTDTSPDIAILVRSVGPVRPG